MGKKNKKNKQNKGANNQQTSSSNSAEFQKIIEKLLEKFKQETPEGDAQQDLRDFLELIAQYPAASKLIAILKENSPESVAGEISNLLQNDPEIAKSMLERFGNLKEFVKQETAQELDVLKQAADNELKEKNEAAEKIQNHIVKELEPKEKELLDKIADLNKDINETLTPKKDSLEGEINTKQEKLDGINQALEESGKKKQELDEREAKVEKNEKEIADKQKNIQQEVQYVSGLRQLMTKDMSLESKCNELESANNQLSLRCKDLEGQVHKLTTDQEMYQDAEKIIKAYEVQKKESLITSQQDQITSLQGQLKADRESLTALKNSELETQRQAIEALEQRNNELLVQVQNLRGNQQVNEEIKNENALLKQKADTFKSMYDQMKAWMEKGNKAECPALSALDKDLPEKAAKFEEEIKIKKYKQIESLAELAKYLYDFSLAPWDDGEVLYYTKEDIMAFIAGLGIGKLTILQGTSGTGKSSLPKMIGRALHLPEFTGGIYPNMIAVGSSWRERDEMFGYYNDFSKKFKAKEFTCAAYKANFYKDRPYFIVLDEMNLSRVEYYFADILSGIDDFYKNKDQQQNNGLKIRLLDKEEMQGEYPAYLQGGELTIPNNVYFIGTANVDPSTFEITDKVYDRANVLNFLEPVKSKYIPAPPPRKTITFTTLQNQFDKIIKEVNEKAKQAREEEDPTLPDIYKTTIQTLKKLDIFIGYRMEKQLREFIAIFEACGGTKNEAADLFIVNKILRKMKYKEGTQAVKEDFIRLAESYSKEENGAGPYLRCWEFLDHWNEQNFPKE